MKRRGFLGPLGGAAAAGPVMAKTAIAEMPKSIGMVAHPPIGGPLSQAISSTAGGGDWRLSEIANLKRIISGDLNEEEKEQMRRDRMRELREQIRLSETRGYLSRLLREISK